MHMRLHESSGDLLWCDFVIKGFVYRSERRYHFHSQNQGLRRLVSGCPRESTLGLVLRLVDLSFLIFPAFLRLLLHFAVSEFLTSFVDELDGLELFDGRVDAENPAPPGGRVEKLECITSLV